jgi:integrase/recombinase XerD
MADKYWALRQQIGRYIERMRTRGMSPKHIESAEYILYMRFAKPLRDAGLELNVRKIGEREIMFLMNHEFGGTKKTRFWYLSIVSTFLKKNGNNIVDTLDLQRPQDIRTNVDWLTEGEERRVWDYILNHVTPLERAVLTLELGAGLRRIEVMRLTVGSMTPGSMTVLGKGRGGGKPRTVVINRTVREALGVWMMERGRMVDDVLKRNPRARISESLVVHDKNGIHGYSENGMDRILDRVKEKMSEHYQHRFTFSHHTMRRTFGRRLYLTGAWIEEIQHILGHETPAMTYRYLGLNANDQETVLNEYDSFIQSLEEGAVQTLYRKR